MQPFRALQHYIKTFNYSSLLSSNSVSTQYIFKGTLDIAIVDKVYAETGYIAGGLFVGIEVKKNVEYKHDMQTILELLLANVASQYPFIMLLTAIVGYMYFRPPFGRGQCNQTKFGPGCMYTYLLEGPIVPNIAWDSLLPTMNQWNP